MYRCPTIAICSPLIGSLVKQSLYSGTSCKDVEMQRSVSVESCLLIDIRAFCDQHVDGFQIVATKRQVKQGQLVLLPRDLRSQFLFFDKALRRGTSPIARGKIKRITVPNLKLAPCIVSTKNRKSDVRYAEAVRVGIDGHDPAT